MADYTGLILFVGVLAGWTALLYVLDWKGVLQKRNLLAFGPFLMVKTRRGRDFIDRLARRRRAWQVFGDVSIALVALTMVGITALLAWEATLVRSIPADRAPGPELLLGIPGINPVIPIGYGIFGLVVAVVIHEFFHGILARTANVKIESLGVLFAIVPIGAFVEPEEAGMRALPRRERARLYAAGASINILLALVFGFLFSTMMMSVVPAQQGIGIIQFTNDTAPAKVAGIPERSIITYVNSEPTPTLVAFQAVMATTHPGEIVPVSAWKDGVTVTRDVTLGNDSGRPILGIQAMETTTSYYHPFTDLDRYGGLPGALLQYIALPFTGRAPLQSPATDFYVVTGPLGAMPTSVFYLIANTLYWLFWLNLMLGATNALPAVPLDGGYVFKDGVGALLARFRKGVEPARRERSVRIVSYAFALLILSLILWQIIGPRLPF